jgi:hypothetical protein
MFAPVVSRILKHNMDFGKSPRMRNFVEDYILALREDGPHLEMFISAVHGATHVCPHPRVLPNLASICFSAINKLHEEKPGRQRQTGKENRVSVTPAAPVLPGDSRIRWMVLRAAVSDLYSFDIV